MDLAGTIPFDPPTPQDVTDADVLRALEALPHVFQEVLLLADVQELSYKEIAATVQIPMGTVMSRLYRARRMMRQQLAGWTRAKRPYPRAVGEDRSD